MADAQDSKSCDGNIMSVRPRPPAPLKIFYFIQSKQFIKTWVHPQKVFYFYLHSDTNKYIYWIFEKIFLVTHKN